MFELHHYLLLITFKVKANKEKYLTERFSSCIPDLILFFTFIISGLFDCNFVAKMLIINEISKIGTIIEDFRHFEIENDSWSETWLRDKKGLAKVSFVLRLKTRLDIIVFEKLWSKNKYENNLKDFCLTKPFRHFDTKFHKTRSI